MLKPLFNQIANMVFYLFCIVFIASLTAVYYFNHFSIVIKNHVLYWVYLAPLAMVLYTLIKNYLFNRTFRPSERDGDGKKPTNALEPDDKNS